MPTKLYGYKRMVFQIGWAKSGTWSITTKHGQKHIPLLHIGLITFEQMTALQIFLGPITILFGLAKVKEGE